MKIKPIIISLLIMVFFSACQAEKTVDEQNGRVEPINGFGEFVVTSLSDSNYVIYHDEEEYPVDEHYIPVFVNGELVKNSGIPYEKGFLIQIEVLSQLLGTELINDNGNWSIENEQYTILLNGNEKTVEINGHKESIIIEKNNDDIYIDIAVMIPYLDWVSSYYYKDTDQEDQSLVPHNNAIYLDEPLTEVFVETKKSGKKLAQTLASEALENYSVS